MWGILETTDLIDWVFLKMSLFWSVFYNAHTECFLLHYMQLLYIQMKNLDPSESSVTYHDMCNSIIMNE